MRFFIQMAIKNEILFSFLIAILFFSAGCEKDAEKIGKELLPPAGVIRFDNAKVQLATTYKDTIITSNRVLNLLGEIDDPNFGRIKADYYSQFALTGSNVTFPTNAVLDSVSLQLYLINPYGTSESVLEWEVYELQDSMSAQTNYNLYQDGLQTIGSELTNAAPFQFSKTIVGELVSVRLSNSLGEKLLYAPAEKLKDNTSFFEYFKGLKIGLKRNSGIGRSVAIQHLVGSSWVGRVRVFYHFPRGDEMVATYYDFVKNANAKNFHTVKRTNTENTLYQKVLTDTAFARTRSVIQAGTGTIAKISIQGLDSIIPNPVNMAKLRIYADTTDASIYPLPPNLWLFFVNKDGSPADREFASAKYNATFGGYEFRIDAYVQAIVAGQIENNGLYVFADLPQIPTSLIYNLERAILWGEKAPNYTPKLTVYYTKIPR